MKGKIRILIVDDHAMVRQGLAQILEKNDGMEVVASFSNGADTLRWLRNHNCDAALLDVAMPDMNGIELLKQIKANQSKFPVLIISAYPESQYAVRLIKAGASGYLNKECAPEEIIDAVRNVVEGKMHLSPDAVKMLVNEINLPDERLPHETLSIREFQIFKLIVSAKTVTEIADSTHLSSKTISTYRSRILEKMHLHNNVELMRYAVEHQLFE
jgi:DNA-binding NarL/FixJ family response regulator